MQRRMLIWILHVVVVPLFLVACSGKREEHSEAGGGVFSSIPNPAIVVANGGGAAVTILDPATLSVVSTVPVAEGLHPHHLSVAPDQSRLLVTATSADLSMGHSGAAHQGHAGHGDGARTIIYQLDVDSRELRAVANVDATVHNAAFTPDGSSVVLSLMEHGMVIGSEPATFAQTFSISGFGMPLEVTPTSLGSLLVAESGSGRVALVDLASQTVVNRFEVGEVPVAAWASGHANYFVSVEEGKKLRHLLEASSNVILDSHTIDLGGTPGQAILTPNGQELWVAVEDRAMLAVFDATSHEKLAEFPAGTKPHAILFEPDGKRAFVTDEEGSRILVVDVAGRFVSSQIEVSAKPNGIAWLAR